MRSEDRYQVVLEISGWVIYDVHTGEIVWGSSNSYNVTEDEAKEKARCLNTEIKRKDK